MSSESSRFRSWPFGASLPRLTRRRFLASSGAAVCGVGSYTWLLEPHWVELVERDLPIAGLPQELAGQKLVQISDLHVGPVVDSSYLIRALQWVSALRPALTVITGDFMTCEAAEQLAEVSQVMRHLVAPRYGCFAILGNHDYAWGWAATAVADELVSRLGDCGIQVLRNECRTVAGLQLVGLDDFWGPRFHPEYVLPQVDWHRPALTLCHNPDGVDEPAMSAVRGWILSGHTHGGQCKPPWLTPPIVPVKNPRYVAGEVDLGDGRRLYINRGLGYLRRVRFNARPEITVFTLRPEPPRPAPGRLVARS